MQEKDNAGRRPSDYILENEQWCEKLLLIYTCGVEPDKMRFHMHAKKDKPSSTCLGSIDFDSLMDAPLPPSSDKLREVNRVLSARCHPINK